jgi:hypothetical protein
VSLSRELWNRKHDLVQRLRSEIVPGDRVILA